MKSATREGEARLIVGVEQASVCNAGGRGDEPTAKAIATKDHLMRPSLVLAVLFPVVVATPAVAQPIRPYSAAALQAAQRAGQPVLVDVHADWCPTCRAQEPTIQAISRDPAFAKLLILKLDFDSQVAERRALRVAKQSTLIAYRGTGERARATGIVAPEQIRALAASALR